MSSSSTSSAAAAALFFLLPFFSLILRPPTPLLAAFWMRITSRESIDDVEMTIIITTTTASERHEGKQAGREGKEKKGGEKDVCLSAGEETIIDGDDATNWGLRARGITFITLELDVRSEHTRPGTMTAARQMPHFGTSEAGFAMCAGVRGGGG